MNWILFLCLLQTAPQQAVVGELLSIRIVRPANLELQPLPKEGASMRDWKDYATATILAMFPDEKSELDKTSIIPTENSGRINGSIFLSNREALAYTINLNVSLLREVVKSPEEFATLVGHEFAHFIVLRDESPTSPMDVEIAADRIAAEKMNGGGCHLAVVIGRLIRSEIYQPIQDDETRIENGERIGMLKERCSQEQ